MKLYRLANNLGEYYVIATDMTSAEEKLKKILDVGGTGEGYGYSRDRKVTHCNLVAEEIVKFNDAKGTFDLHEKFLIL